MSETPAGFPRSKEEQAHRPWACPKANPVCTRGQPCPSCLGRRNRRKGKRRQAAGRKALEQLTGVTASWRGKLANEETWSHLPVRVEVKAGAQVKAIATKFLSMEKQAEQSRALGDNRPFIADAEPDGMGDGILMFRRSQLAEIVEALTQ